MPEIGVTTVRLLPETNRYENLKIMSAGSVTAVSSISGKHNVQHVSYFLKIVVS